MILQKNTNLALKDSGNKTVRPMSENNNTPIYYIYAHTKTQDPCAPT